MPDQKLQNFFVSGLGVTGIRRVNIVSRVIICVSTIPDSSLSIKLIEN